MNARKSYVAQASMAAQRALTQLSMEACGRAAGHGVRRIHARATCERTYAPARDSVGNQRPLRV
eukprot:10726034-Lingulodinium_polyedra.AAC.1